MDSGEPSVITPGTVVMLVWSVDSWDTPCLVRNDYKCYIKNYGLHKFDWLLQELFLLKLLITMEEEQEQY